MEEKSLCMLCQGRKNNWLVSKKKVKEIKEKKKKKEYFNKNNIS